MSSCIREVIDNDLLKKCSKYGIVNMKTAFVLETLVKSIEKVVKM